MRENVKSVVTAPSAGQIISSTTFQNRKLQKKYIQKSKMINLLSSLLMKKYFFVRHYQNLRIFFCVNGFCDFDKCHNLSKRNVKLILKILSELEPLRVSSNKKTLYSTRSCVNWASFDIREPLKRSFHSRFKLAHLSQKRPNLHTNSLNKLLM
jgi:hypothetical protein